MERFDLTALIKGVFSTMDIMIRQKEARVIFNETEPLYVWADEFKTEEVVTNYVSNALHHLDGEKNCGDQSPETGRQSESNGI